MRQTRPMKWWKIAAYNAESSYGYGTWQTAEAACGLLNQDREINLYAPYDISDDPGELENARRHEDNGALVFGADHAPDDFGPHRPRG